MLSTFLYENCSALYLYQWEQVDCGVRGVIDVYSFWMGMNKN